MDKNLTIGYFIKIIVSICAVAISYAFAVEMRFSVSEGNSIKIDAIEKRFEKHEQRQSRVNEKQNKFQERTDATLVKILIQLERIKK